MIEVTITKLAEEIQIPVERLLQQFAEAGIQKQPGDYVTQREKEFLLSYLNMAHGGSMNPPDRLTLQRKTRSTISVPSSSGRSKFIQVEVRKKRTYVKRNTVEPTCVTPATEMLPDEAAPAPSAPAEGTPSFAHSPATLHHRTSKSQTQPEQKKRLQQPALVPLKKEQPQKLHAKVIEEKSLKTDTKNQMHALEKAQKEAEIAALRRKAEEEAHRKAEENARRLVEEARRLAEENEKTWEAPPQNESLDGDYHLTTSLYAREAEDEEDHREESGRRAQTRGNKAVKQKKGHKLSETKAAREEERTVFHKGRDKQSTLLQHAFNRPAQPVTREISISETITVAELAAKMAVKGSEVIKVLMKMGILATINQSIDQETAQLVAEEMGHKVILHREDALEAEVISDRDLHNVVQLEPRAPVVTIMGHVDHGKTSLLDYIRSAKVASREAGGITQHIGAYHVEIENSMITFLDTPGHAAFTAMRARGAKVTDIVVLVVAADDGVMPQTVEAIQHAQAAQVALIVAVNKMDKPGANPEQIKQALVQHQVLAEEWGGETQFVHVSAKTGMGVDALLKSILLQAELLELKAMHHGMASGVVIESFLDKGRGPVATVLVQQGTLQKGNTILCGFEYGKVRAMRNELGKEVLQAGPSTPVQVLGLSGVATAGDSMVVVRDEKKAREVALYRQHRHREVKLAGQKHVKLENLFVPNSLSSTQEVNLIVKADVQGSVEAICEALLQLSTDEVKVKIVASGVGAFTESDVTLAAAAQAILIGFNIRADATARRIAEQEGLDLRYYAVIYDIIDEIKQAMSGLLAPERKQKTVGLLEIRDLFRSPKFGTVAGCMVVEGFIKRHHPIRVLRDNIVIYQGELASLRRFKEDVSEVQHGMECGIGIKGYSDLSIGDKIEVYEDIEIQRSIT